jgi:hypothetical protein
VFDGMVPYNIPKEEEIKELAEKSYQLLIT